MKNEANYFINNPIFVKYKKRFNFMNMRFASFIKSANINERIIEIPFAIQALCGLPLGAKILDLGCTESPLPLQCAGLGYAVTGFDFRPYPYLHPNLNFVKGDMTQLPFEQESFDAVMCISTLEHVGIGFYTDPQEVKEADTKAVGQIARVLKPGGILVLTVPYGVGSQNTHQRVYDQKALEKMLKAFTVQEARYYQSTVVPGAIANTWVEIKQDQALRIESPHATTCVCLLKARKNG